LKKGLGKLGYDDVVVMESRKMAAILATIINKTDKNDASRFENSRDVAAYIGLTPSQYSSGETQKQGGISKKGSKRTRYLLVEAATVLLTRCKVWSKLKAWGMKLLRKKGKKKAIVAVARKLAVIMHKMLLTRKPFERTTEKKEKIAA
jgi:transposase